MLRRNGFSLLELMVAVGISGIAAVGVMKMTEDQVKVAKKVTVEYDIDTLVTAAQKIIVNKKACNATFNGLTINTGAVGALTPLNIINGPAGNPLIQNTAGSNQFGDLVIQRIDFVYRGDIDSSVVAGTQTNQRRIIGDVEITAARNSKILTIGATGGNANFTRRLPYPVELVTDPAGNINTATSEAGCINSATNVDEEIVDAFCLMITANNVKPSDPGGPPSDVCDPSFVGTETGGAGIYNNFFGAGPLSDPDKRAVSHFDISNQIGGYQELDDANLNNATLLNTNRETAAKFIALDRDQQAGNLVFSNLVTIERSILNSDDPRTVVNVEYLKNNFLNITSCNPGEIGVATKNGVRCYNTSCGTNQYSEGLDENNINCRNFANNGNNCIQGSCSLKVVNGTIEFRP